MSLFRETADVSVRPAVPGDDVAVTAIQVGAWRSSHAEVLGADVLDALLSSRPYKAPWSLDEALAWLQGQSGKLFDPRCVDALVRNRPRLEEICRRYSSVRTKPGLDA